MRLMPLFVFVFLVLTGCSSVPVNYEEIVRASLRVNTSDGVDHDEALILAPYHIIRLDLIGHVATLTPIEIKRKKVWLKDKKEFVLTIPPSGATGFKMRESWIVFFESKKDVSPPRWLFLELDARTGEFIRLGLERARR